MPAPKFATKAYKHAWARKELNLRADAPAHLPRLLGEFDDRSARAKVEHLRNDGKVAVTTDQFGDRWNHFSGLVVWYCDAKWVKTAEVTTP